MSFDLVIWRRSETTKTAMLADAYNAICNDCDHPAMAPFDLAKLEHALRAEFGDLDAVDGPIWCETNSTAAANWMIVQCSHSEAESITARVVPIAIGQGLLVYDPQRECVWGNKRPPKKKT